MYYFVESSLLYTKTCPRIRLSTHKKAIISFAFGGLRQRRVAALI
jgi:hypothetical protein